MNKVSFTAPEQTPGSSPNEVIHHFEYCENEYTENHHPDIPKTATNRAEPWISWINVESIEDSGLIEQFGRIYELHPLTVEDILSMTHRPKFEEFDEYIYIVVKMLTFDAETISVKSEQVSIILKGNVIISFLEDAGDLFDPVREKIRSQKSKIRRLGPDYLVYSLLDAVVDQYFKVIESLGECVEDLQDSLISSPAEETVQSIHHLKREIILLRRSIWPLREVIASIERNDSGFFKETTRIYLRDLYDHTIHTIETIETYRDLFSNMLDIYLSSLNNKMNSVMKVLTIIATIFIPLTFIASIYGMNFQNMPELKMPMAYPAVLSAMIVLAIIMIVYFKIKKWW